MHEHGAIQMTHWMTSARNSLEAALIIYSDIKVTYLVIFNLQSYKGLMKDLHAVNWMKNLA